MLVCLILLLLFVLLKADSSCQQGKNNCILCNPISKLCLECEYDVYTPDKNGGCEEAKICILGKNFCNECDEDGKLCTACEDGYFPDKNGGCSYSNNCEVSFKGKCLKCKKNYILNENINICRSLNLEEFRNCEKIRLSDATCEKCMDGYYLNSEDKKCTKIENCKQSIFGKCILCNKGYYLDKKEEKCKEQKENLLYCKEVLEGINCNQCEDNYYFDKDGNCVGSNYCLKRGELGKCKECLTGYFLSNSGGVCTTTENCYTGIKSEGICNKCVSGYYLDYKDGKCKSNQEENDFKNCIFVDGVCIECSLKYFLSDEHKCSSTLHCAEEINGICIECKQNYYLGLDNKCSNIEHCLYSNLLDCTECEDTFYYEKNSKKCKKWDENFENCIYGYENKGCDKCKVDFYLNMTDKLC